MVPADAGVSVASRRGRLRQSLRASLHSSSDRAAAPAPLRSSLGGASLDSHDWGVHEAGGRLLGGGARASSGALISQEMRRVERALQRNAPPPVSWY